MTNLKTVTFDIESTGVDTENDRIITCFLRAREGDRNIFERNWIINAGVEVPKEASDVHGMTTEWVKENGRTDVSTAIFEIAETLASYAQIGYIVCGFNHAYDLAILDAEVQRHHNVRGLPAQDAGRVCDRLADVAGRAEENLGRAHHRLL